MTFDLEAFRLRVLDDPLVRMAWDDKYRARASDGSSCEENVSQTRERVVRGVYAKDPSKLALEDALWLVQGGYLVPAGRVNAGAGLERRVTLANCFVSETVQDSMPGIQRAIMNAALTMQQGGGIGTDFSTVRPAGAIVRNTGSVSSGVIPFMDQQDAMCSTISSAGSRRGAMMGTLDCSHPDLWNEEQFETSQRSDGTVFLRRPSFISAKRQRGRLTQFNVSVLVSDAFMHAVEDDEDWDLGFHVPRADGEHVAVYDRPFAYDVVDYDNEGGSRVGSQRKGDVAPWYVYRRVSARRIWEDVMRSTYVYAEPGVLFIDRINRMNNLSYCEDIRATNPCGEQPLPPHGCCDLSSVNTAFMVKDPFTPHATFDVNLFRHTVYAGVRFLDNVLDVTGWPLEAQRHESDAKRRIGLGITGWADALAQLGVVYGSGESVVLSVNIARQLQEAAYAASAQLAAERGPFPLYDSDKFLASPNVQKLSTYVVNTIKKHGMRNGVVNTVAPNGTISLYVGNVSSGIEPIFSTEKFKRKVRQPDGSFKEYEAVDYAQRLFEEMRPGTPLPSYFVGAHDVHPRDHIRVACAWQRYVDASISKTVNCPTDFPFDEFSDLYLQAYCEGAKGCTTYRYDPAAGRGSVLSEADKKETLKPEQPKAEFTSSAAWFEPLPLDGKMTAMSESFLFRPADFTAALHEGSAEPPVKIEPVIAAPFESEPWIKQMTEEITRDVIEALNKETRTVPSVRPRPGVVPGNTYCLKWPPSGENSYITITNVDGVPLEVFIKHADSLVSEWADGLSRMVTGVLRRGGDVRFVVEQLKQVASAKGGAFIADQQRFRPSVVAAIGGVIEREFLALGVYGKPDSEIKDRKLSSEPDDAKEQVDSETKDRKLSSELDDAEEPEVITTVDAGYLASPDAWLFYKPQETSLISGRDFYSDAPAAPSMFVEFTGGPRGDVPVGNACPICGSHTFIAENGCHRCLSCGHEACG